jgi:hypothetical protein
MKHGIWMAAAAAAAVLAISSHAKAEEFPGGTACVTGNQSPWVGKGWIDDGRFRGESSATVTQAYCSLQRMTCASFPCTKTATITALDNNSGTNDDQNVRCRLNVYQKGGAAHYQYGNWVTLGASVGTYGTLSLSVTLSSFNPNDGFLIAECLLGKDAGAGPSEIAWASANN